MRDSIGGGIYCSNSSAVITNCVVVGNTTGGLSSIDGGGGILLGRGSTTIKNCTISGNLTPHKGGGIFCLESSTATITNAIVWGNSASEGPEIALSDHLGASSLAVSYCDVKGGEADISILGNSVLIWGLGNMDANPLFRDAGAGDYHLQFCSPCIDAGIFCEEDPELCLFSNEPFPNGDRVNIGAYANTAEATDSSQITDDDGDGFSECDNDCDDADPTVNPGAHEITGNYIDEDCNGDLGPCDPNAEWKSHGEYVSCVADSSKDLERLGIITKDERSALLTNAAQSDVGKK